MSSLLANIAKSIIAKFRPQKAVNRFTDIGWFLEKILKHEDDQSSKVRSLEPGKVFYQRPYELLHTYRDIFVNEIYLFKAKQADPVILDCGSNIGLSVLYFKTIYPNALVWAFEPDKSNFELLEKNIQQNQLKMVNAASKAVWIQDGFISFSGKGSEASRIDANNEDGGAHQVPCIRLKTFMQDFATIDFLKMDIEGGEYAVLKDIAEELHRVQHFFLEYHGKTTETNQLKELLEIINRQGFQVYIRNAADKLKHPFIEKSTGTQFDVQLNIFCYK